MSLHAANMISNYMYLITQTMNSSVLGFLLLHVFLGVLLTSLPQKSKSVTTKNWIFFYFLTINAFLLLVTLYKFFLANQLLTVTFNSINIYGDVSLFSDTLTCLALSVTVVSWVYLSERYLFKVNFFSFYFFIFVVCTILMVSSTNLVQMFIYFEFIFLPSLFFVYQFGYSKKVTKSILFLLTWTLTGSFLVLMALAYLWGVYGVVDFESLRLLKFSLIENTLLFICFFCGFAVKIPLWPFYYWLIKVHVEAPTGFSIFLSGFLVKTAFYCLTFFYFIFYSQTLNVIALTMIMWGAYDASVRMWSSLDIKKLIAYATVQEMNLIALFLVLLANINLSILNLFLLVHGLLSALFFFLVDQVQKQFGSRNSILVSGLAVFTPLLVLVIWLGLLIFRGFPIFVKFFVEWELLHLLYSNFTWLGIFFFLLCAVYGVLGFSKTWFGVLYSQPTGSVVLFDLLKRDLTTASSLISSLFVLSFFLPLF